MEALAREYLTALEDNLSWVMRKEWGRLAAAADLAAQTILDGHTVYIHLGGHLMPHEAQRADQPRLFVPLTPGEADRLQPDDVLVMTHQYGVLEPAVELAIAAKKRGATLIVISPRSDPRRIIRRHPSGTAVFDHADILIDTHIPYGDAAIQAPAGGPGACPTSGVIQAALHWALTCGVAERLAERSMV